MIWMMGLGELENHKWETGGRTRAGLGLLGGSAGQDWGQSEGPEGRTGMELLEKYWWRCTEGTGFPEWEDWGTGELELEN